MTVGIHHGANYRITCRKCDYDKLSSTKWGAKQAAHSHHCDAGLGHLCKVAGLKDQ